MVIIIIIIPKDLNMVTSLSDQNRKNKNKFLLYKTVNCVQGKVI